MDFTLKNRIFNPKKKNNKKFEPIFSNSDKPKFSLEEIMEFLEGRETKANAAIVSSKIKMKPSELEDSLLLLDEAKLHPKIILYETDKNTYYVYRRIEKEEKEKWFNYIKAQYQIKQEEKTYDLFVPTGVTINRVPQNVLGTGVLGRAFIYQLHIEILDSLVGNAYQEVLTHEVLHIIHPEKKEVEIRSMTKMYVGAKSVYH